jgi:uncharacterized protein YbjT (DUF2867 family)
MSEPRRVLLVGATGLIGTSVMRAAVDRPAVRLVALARREVPLPEGARMEMLLAPTEDWPDAIRTIAPDAVICALGTTWKQAGRDEAAFRAVDQALVLDVAHAARAAGAGRFVLVSSVGAAIGAKSFYLQVKGEVEEAMAKLRFDRLDILRPGLLLGARGADRRLGERLGIMLSPLSNLVLQGDWRHYRSIAAQDVARAALQCIVERPNGRFVHEHDALCRLAPRWDDQA